jgi:endonuclease YncB( thermonuclease family)
MQKLISTVAAILAFSTSAFGQDLHGKVISIADGDTLTVLDNQQKTHKVRLSGIDAPEKSQAFGQASKQSLGNQVYGKPVVIDWNKRDRYGRIIGKVLLGSRDVNLMQIQLGMAWHYKKYEGEQDVEDRSIYSQAEYIAQRDRRGLWQDANPIPPWDFRKSRR